jgi:phosphoribosylformylglycinamidine synthase
VLGARIDLPNATHIAAATALFNESQSRIVISCTPNDAEKTLAMLGSKNIPHQKLGEVVVKTLSIKTPDAEFSWPIEMIYDDWFNAIRRAVESDAEPVRSL